MATPNQFGEFQICFVWMAVITWRTIGVDLKSNLRIMNRRTSDLTDAVRRNVQQYFWPVSVTTPMNTVHYNTIWECRSRTVRRLTQSSRCSKSVAAICERNLGLWAIHIQLSCPAERRSTIGSFYWRNSESCAISYNFLAVVATLWCETAYRRHPWRQHSSETLAGDAYLSESYICKASEAAIEWTIEGDVRNWPYSLHSSSRGLPCLKPRARDTQMIRWPAR